MITLGTTTVDYDYMGAFTGEAGWRHPTVTLTTYELILVTEGEVFLFEGETEYTLRRGDYILLSPGIPHGGTRESTQRVAFTWLHFRAENFEALAIPKTGTPGDAYRAEYRLRELGHLAQGNAETSYVETELLSLLFGFKYAALPQKDKLCADAAEYIRVHVAEAPTAKTVAAAFSYSPDHLSRKFRAAYRLSLKQYIERERVAYVKRALLSQSLSVKEIAAEAGFEDGNRLSKFFKYHTGQTPEEYRSAFYASHTNIR